MADSFLSVPGLDIPYVPRGRSASLAWVDFLVTESPNPDNDDRRPSIPVYNDWKEETIKQETIDHEIFNTYEDGCGKILVGKFLAMLESNGLKRSDYRLHELFLILRRMLKEQEVLHRGRQDDDFVGSIETLHLTREEFLEVILPDILIISTAFRDQFIIPKFDMFCQQIEDIYNDCQAISSGKVAPYLKKLTKFDPNCWGVSVCSIDGQRYSVGDTNTPVTLHALSKPLMYGFALQEIGKQTVHKYVGLEPSGHFFNELVLDQEKRPHNPMINAGSIMVHALLQAFVQTEMSSAERFDHTHDLFLKMSGLEYIGFNNGMFLSKRQASDRNWALGHYMKEYNCFPPGTDLADCIEYYLQTSSLETTCEVLSVVAATLANGGICPVTGHQVLASAVVADVLSMMFSCGMSEYSGKFGFEVGLPAKSSISGLILLIVPNVCGMALWSPPLDEFSNSGRGIAFCEKLVKTFNFHCFDTLRTDKVDPIRKTVETKGSNVITLLFSAANGDLDSIFRLHLCGNDMGVFDCDGRTALHIAASDGHYDVVEYLLRQCGVHHQRKDRWNRTAYDEAIMHKSPNHKKIAELLRTWHPGKRSYSSNEPAPIDIQIAEADSSDEEEEDDDDDDQDEEDEEDQDDNDD